MSHHIISHHIISDHCCDLNNYAQARFTLSMLSYIMNSSISNILPVGPFFQMDALDFNRRLI